MPQFNIKPLTHSSRCNCTKCTAGKLSKVGADVKESKLSAKRASQVTLQINRKLTQGNHNA